MNNKNSQTLSFRQLTKTFWNTFTKNEALIRKLIDDKVEANILIETLKKIIETAFHEIAFEVGFNGTKYELILSPNGNESLLKQIRYLLDGIPEELKKYWTFYSTKPALGKEGMNVNIYNKNLSAADFTIYTKLEEKKKIIHIDVYAPKLDDLEEELRYNALYIMLDLFIGELYTMEYIGAVKFMEIPKRKNQEVISLSKMHAYINYLIEEHNWDKTKDPLANYILYKCDIKEGSKKLRDDVYIGGSSSYDIIRQLTEKEIYPLKKLAKDGVFMGYIFYSNQGIDQSEIINFRTNIEDEIESLTASLGIANSTGGATGTNNSYIDFIIYDLDIFLDIIKKVMDKYTVSFKGFTFFDNQNATLYF